MPERSQAGIVSRITRKVASEGGSAAGTAIRRQIPPEDVEKHGISALNSCVLVTPP
jgi:hypothetical protein